jgi:SARP family transcriptional regulator, regulator of embCAB operon
MKFRILGQLEVHNGSEDCTPTAPKQREVLGLLLTRADRTILIPDLLEELWGNDLPPTAVRTLQTYIYQLREKLARAYSTGTRAEHPAEPIITQPHGYMLKIRPGDEMDAQSFRHLTNQGHVALEAGRFAEASALLDQALKLWTGPALGDVHHGHLIEMHAAQLAEERLAALEWRITADLQLGRFHELTSELAALVAEFPMHEGLRGHLMTALYRSGRRSEALTQYRWLRQFLIETVGMEPSKETQELHEHMLRDDLCALSSRNAVTRS